MIAAGLRDDRLRVAQLDGPFHIARGTAADAGRCDALAWQAWARGGRTWLVLVNSAPSPVRARVSGRPDPGRAMIGPPARDGMVALPGYGVSVLEWVDEGAPAP